MGIRSEVQTALAAALNNPDELGDISRDFEYEDPEMQVRTQGRGWRSTIRMFELDDESTHITDLKFKFLQNELAVNPEIDGIIHVDGNPHYIYRVTESSSKATWTVYARG